ncbi:hypothetical protein BDP27DRAFT_1432480 [Rhodocollybia butyracea]|uniref:Cyanovirin-N domain-containing protein n=1 Tax=Rhodocollybia butyracea TaxID=206335 RepID=A0A9P5TYQ1_9AGAR|nr:hypothetical protein BDP27DRAFT_1432480 [Rhodocollybia butyracea]
MSSINSAKTPPPQPNSAMLATMNVAEDLKTNVASDARSNMNSVVRTSSESTNGSSVSFSEKSQYSSFKNVKTTTMSFAQSTRKLHISAAGVLSAECLLADGKSWRVSTFDLYKYLGIIHGELKWGYKDFHHASESFRIEGTKLVVKCKLNGGQTKECWFDLAIKLRVDNGVIIVIEYHKGLSTMFSEVPWMKFKVVAEPDFSVFATHSVMQATMQKIAQSTVEHVSAQMTSVMSQAIAQAIEVVAKSAFEHISQIMEVMVQDLSIDAQAHASVNTASKLQISHQNILSNGDVKDALPPRMPPSIQSPQQSIVPYFDAPVPAPGFDIGLQGYIAPGYNPSIDIEKISKATKVEDTDELALIGIFAHLGSLPMAVLSATYEAKTGQSLDEVLKSVTSGYFAETLHGLVCGPLWYDVELLQSAIEASGKDTLFLTEILVDRTWSDRQHLSKAYQVRYGRDLQADIDLDGKTKQMFDMILSANPPLENGPVDPLQVESDVTALYKAGQGKLGTDEIAFCEVIINRSRIHLTAVCNAYGKKYQSLTKVIKSVFSGHMQQALLFIVNGAKSKHTMGPGVWRDAKMLEKSMKGKGIRDMELVRRIIRYHWNKPRFEEIKKAYHQKYSTTLDGRISGEIGGDYMRIMVAIAKGV